VISCEAYRRLFIKLDSIFYAAGLSVLPNIKALARPRQQTVPARMPLHTCSHQHMHAQNLVVALAPACRLSPPGMPPKSTTHAACQGRPTRSCPSSMSVCVSLLLPFRRRDLSPVSPRLCAQGRDGYKSRPSILPHTMFRQSEFAFGWSELPLPFAWVSLQRPDWVRHLFRVRQS
jgi:hypothetical protein